MYAVTAVPTSRLRRATIACALACALVVPAVSSAQDRASSATSSLAGTTSPHAGVSTSSLAGTTSAPSQDLRSADNRDPLMRQGTLGAPDVTVVKLPQPAPVNDNPGIDPRGLGIGAAIMLALVALWFAGGAAVRQHRRSGLRPATTV